MSEIILGIETSGEETGLAFVEHTTILNEVKKETGAKHNETIYDLLTDSLQSLGVKVKDLSGIGVSIGPGMFTSLRIGLAFAKGLAVPFSLKIVGVNTLDALAESVPNRDLLLAPIIDARKGEVFSSFYKQGLRISDYRIVRPDELVEQIQEPVLFVGNGLEKIEARLREGLGSLFHCLAENIRTPAPSIIAVLGERRLQSGESDRIEDLEPFYLRRTDAELTKERKI